MEFESFVTELQKEMLVKERNWVAGMTSVAYYYLSLDDAKLTLDGCRPSEEHEPPPEQKKNLPGRISGHFKSRARAIIHRPLIDGM